MRIYLAARYSRISEVRQYALLLAHLGHTVTSRWLCGTHELDRKGLSLEAELTERTRFAEEDYADVTSADMTILFTEEPRSHSSRGGRFVEMGIALASGQEVAVVGPLENVFCCLERVMRFAAFADVELYLRATEGVPAKKATTPDGLTLAQRTRSNLPSGFFARN